jgi:hypothetical protein
VALVTSGRWPLERKTAAVARIGRSRFGDRLLNRFIHIRGNRVADQPCPNVTKVQHPKLRASVAAVSQDMYSRWMSMIYAPRFVAERDPRLETVREIINRHARKACGEKPQVEDEKAKELAAKLLASGMPNRHARRSAKPVQR